MQSLCRCLLLLLALPAHACVELSGDVRQGALLWGQVAPGSQVLLGDEALAVSEQGIFVLGIGRDETGGRTLTVSGDEECQLTFDIAGREYRIQRIEGVPQRTVTPDPKDLERIRREAAKVSKARKQSSEATDFAGGFAWPVTGRISGVYGSQRVYNGTPGRPHFGVDVAVPTGTPITTPAPGVVTLAEPDLFYSGGTIIVDHGMDVSSSFLHLSEVTVEVGQRVEPGDVIGKVGSTGRATGPHLDWRMNWRNRRVDPELLVPPMQDVLTAQ
ncbi:MAG: M23 family metallopeptidase [Halieaceae bacterium]|nr:M23 family metallopeptidase [Halieaceae bacterium]